MEDVFKTKEKTSRGKSDPILFLMGFNIRYMFNLPSSIQTGM